MKELFIIRGLPGSGKTTFAERVADIVFSADDYFVNEDGEYVFNALKLGTAHKFCRDNVIQAMVWGFNRIAVANTFTTEEEIQPYLDCANEFGYKVFSIIVENRHGSKSVHNVPEKSIARMKNRFSVKLV